MSPIFLFLARFPVNIGNTPNQFLLGTLLRMCYPINMFSISHYPVVSAILQGVFLICVISFTVAIAESRRSHVAGGLRLDKYETHAVGVELPGRVV